jgi:aromatic ring-opening dioxygenase catalytic subunit (LigB family)
MKLPSYFVSHGGGPWSFMDGDFRRIHAKLEAALADIPRQLGHKPRAILMVSGHWEEQVFTVMANPNPPMVYDYSGFPEHTFHVKYNAPGSPDLARRVHDLLQGTGIKTQVDNVRGFDHGAFVPLSVMYPQADVPVVQLSLRSDYDPAAHIAAGRALALLRNEEVLVVGSGLTYHNLRRFTASGEKASHEFDGWLNEILTSSDPQKRTDALVHWDQAPSAREAHPREDHLMPLMVVLGTAETAPADTFYHQDDFFGSLAVSSFRFA